MGQNKKTVAENFYTVETNLQYFIPEFRGLLRALATIIIKSLCKCLCVTVIQN